MTFRELQKHIGRMTANQLDQNIVVEVNNFFYNVESAEVASGEGDYLYKGEVFFTIDSEPLGEKEFDEDGFALNEEVERLNNCDLIKE
jgi:hypothetical protein